MLISFLDWFERHKMGVIGTLTLHTLVLFLFSLWNLRTTPTEAERSDMRIDVVTEAEAEEMVQQILQQENGIPEKVTDLTSNITAEVKPQFSQQRLAERVENDLKAMEQAEFDRLAEERKARGEEVTMPELDPSKWNKELYMDKAAEPVRIEGATTVWHDLKDRVRGSGAPGYLCPEQGRVAVRVSVDHRGAVTKAEIDKAQSSRTDDCMEEHALRSAKNTRFDANPNAPDPQLGTVYFRFLPQ